MKTTLKKKLTAAILAGCSTFILSGVALANPPQPPPPPPTELAQRPTPPPPPPRPFVHNEEVQIIAHNLKVIILGCIYPHVKMLQEILYL